MARFLKRHGLMSPALQHATLWRPDGTIRTAWPNRLFYGWQLPGDSKVFYLVPHDAWSPSHLFQKTSPEARYITKVVVPSERFTEENFTWNLDNGDGVYTGSIDGCTTKRVFPENWDICSQCLKNNRGPEGYDDDMEPEEYCQCGLAEWKAEHEERERQYQAERQWSMENQSDDDIPF